MFMPKEAFRSHGWLPRMTPEISISTPPPETAEAVFGGDGLGYWCSNILRPPNLSGLIQQHFLLSCVSCPLKTYGRFVLQSHLRGSAPTSCGCNLRNKRVPVVTTLRRGKKWHGELTSLFLCRVPGLHTVISSHSPLARTDHMPCVSGGRGLWWMGNLLATGIHCRISVWHPWIHVPTKHHRQSLCLVCVYINALFKASVIPFTNTWLNPK